MSANEPLKGSVFLNQTADELRKYGYVDFANEEFAQEVMAALPRPEFEGVAHIGGVGKWAACGFIYMPRARKKVIALIRGDLREAEKIAASYRRSLKKLLA